MDDELHSLVVEFFQWLFVPIQQFDLNEFADRIFLFHFPNYNADGWHYVDHKILSDAVLSFPWYCVDIVCRSNGKVKKYFLRREQISNWNQKINHVFFDPTKYFGSPRNFPFDSFLCSDTQSTGLKIRTATMSELVLTQLIQYFVRTSFGAPLPRE